MDKCRQLVQTAFELFYEHGVHAVGINRILAESGVAKKTLYHHFSSKDELLVATLAYRDAQFSAWLQARMELQRGRAALLALFDALDDWFNERDPAVAPFHGCFFINTSAEFGDPAHPVYRICSEHKQRMYELIEQHAAVLGEAPGQVARIAQTCMLLKEGAIVQARVAGDSGAALKARHSLEWMLENLSEPRAVQGQPV